MDHYCRLPLGCGHHDWNLVLALQHIVIQRIVTEVEAHRIANGRRHRFLQRRFPLLPVVSSPI
jgi:hypothetical protein